MATVRGRAACSTSATQEQKDSAKNYPATFNLICAEKAASAPCSPYIVDMLSTPSENQCLGLYDLAIAESSQKQEVACCIMNELQCCYPTLNGVYDIDAKMLGLGLDFPASISTCTSVNNFEVCRNPFELAKYASLRMQLAEFKLSDLANLATDLAGIYSVSLGDLSLSLGNVTATRRRRFAPLASSTDVDVSVYINSTSEADILASMNADINYDQLAATLAGNTALGGGATKVTKTEATTSSTQPDPYEPIQYEISGAVEQLHSWPRSGTNEIDLQEPEPWIESIAISVLAPFIVIGVLIFLILPIFHCCRNAKCDNTCSGKPSKFFFLFMLVLIAIGCLLGFLSSAETGSGITGFADGIDSVGSLFTSAIDSVNLAEAAALTANNTLVSLKLECNGGSDAAAIGMINQTVDYNNDVMVSLVEFRKAADPLNGDVSELSDVFKGADSSRESMTYAALAFTLITFILGGIHEAQMLKDGGGFKCTYYLVMLLGMIVMLGAWISGGLNATLGVAVSDVCQDPVGLLASNFDEGSSERLEFENLFYCNRPSEMFAYLETAKDLIPLINLQVTRLQFEHDDGKCQGALFDTKMAQLKTEQQAFTTQVVDTFNLFSCPAIADIFTGIVYDSLCTDLPAGAQLYLGASCMIGIFGLFALCVFRKETVDK